MVWAALSAAVSDFTQRQVPRTTLIALFFPQRSFPSTTHTLCIRTAPSEPAHRSSSHQMASPQEQHDRSIAERTSFQAKLQEIENELKEFTKTEDTSQPTASNASTSPPRNWPGLPSNLDIPQAASEDARHPSDILDAFVDVGIRDCLVAPKMLTSRRSRLKQWLRWIRTSKTSS